MKNIFAITSYHLQLICTSVVMCNSNAIHQDQTTFAKSLQLQQPYGEKLHSEHNILDTKSLLATDAYSSSDKIKKRQKRSRLHKRDFDGDDFDSDGDDFDFDGDNFDGDDHDRDDDHFEGHHHHGHNHNGHHHHYHLHGHQGHHSYGHHHQVHHNHGHHHGHHYQNGHYGNYHYQWPNSYYVRSSG